MRGLLVLIAALLLIGCKDLTITDAIAAANDARAVGEQAHDTIEAVCVPRYQAVQTAEDLEEADALCLGAMLAYDAFAAVHALAVKLISAAQQSGAIDAASAARLVIMMADAGRELAEAVHPILEVADVFPE